MKREETIDQLRALAIFLMIFLHVGARYYNDKAVFFLWDIAHFAVPIFVFCSGYLFFEKELKRENFSSLAYLKKRFLKLLVPYYVFLLIYFIVVFFTQPKTLTQSFIIGSIALTGGVDINWLVLLFIQLTLVLLLIRYLILKRFLFFILFSLSSLFSAFYLLFSNYQLLTTSYKFFMWLPWSLVFIYNYFFLNKEKKDFVIKMIIFASILFLISLGIKLFFNKPLNFYSSKYPPNSYYLFYGLILLNIFYLFFKKFATNKIVNSFFYFVSANSYSIFFIHYMLIYVLVYFSINKITGWPIFFLIVVSLSLIIQYLINYLKSLATARN